MHKKVLAKLLGANPQLAIAAYIVCFSVTGSSTSMMFTGYDMIGKLSSLLEIVEDIDTAMWTKDHEIIMHEMLQEKQIVVRELSSEDLEEIDERAKQRKMLRRFTKERERDMYEN
jgi:hypothetical protein